MHTSAMDLAAMANLAKWSVIGLASPFVARWLYLAARSVYDDVYTRWAQRAHDKLTLNHIRQQNAVFAVRHIEPDDNGRLGVTFDGKTYHNLDTGEVFTQLATVYLDPMRAQIDAIHRMMLAMRGVNAGNARQADTLLEGTRPSPVWPGRVTLDDLLQRYGIRPGYHQIALGLTLDPDTGEVRPVVGDMAQMVHVLLSGASGFGKSTELEALAKQLILGGDCDVCAVDYGVNTFGMLREHLLYPIADTPGLAVALFGTLMRELERRKAAFGQYPQVKDLAQYNALTGEHLRPLVCFVDESAALFRQPETKGPAVDLAQMGRKFGLGLVFAGTDFKADTLPSEATGNFGARIALHLRPSLSQSLLFCRDAANLRDKGRALAALPGTAGLVEMQCPIVETWDDLPPGQAQIELANCAPDGASRPAEMAQATELPRSIEQVDDAGLPDDERVRCIVAAGFSKRQAALRVFGGDAGAAWRKLEQALSTLPVAGSSSSDQENVTGDSDAVETPDSTSTTGSTGRSADDSVAAPDRVGEV